MPRPEERLQAIRRCFPGQEDAKRSAHQPGLESQERKNCKREETAPIRWAANPFSPQRRALHTATLVGCATSLMIRVSTVYMYADSAVMGPATYPTKFMVQARYQTTISLMLRVHWATTTSTRTPDAGRPHLSSSLAAQSTSLKCYTYLDDVHLARHHPSDYGIAGIPHD